MPIQHIKSLIDQVKAKFIIILCHENADPDALCSAFAFSQLLKRMKPGVMVEIACPEGISKLSKSIFRYLSMDNVTEKLHINNANVLVMLDTNTIQQLGDWSEKVKESPVPLIVIDHHASHPETEKIAKLNICDENASSTCEIIYSFFKDLGIKPSKAEAEALFLGIAFDTKHFTLANSNTFKVVADLIDAGVNAREALSRLSVAIDISERIARLKACKRLSLMKIGKWLIVFSHVRSYQASASRGLVEMGAHLAVVGGQRDEKLQISIRSDQEFYKETGFHVGRDLAKPLGEYLHGMGGGHSTAAGVDGIGDFEFAVKRAVKILKEKLRDLPST